MSQELEQEYRVRGYGVSIIIWLETLRGEKWIVSLNMVQKWDGEMALTQETILDRVLKVEKCIQ